MHIFYWQMAIFGGVPPNLKRRMYFNLSFCYNHLPTKTNICAKFERNRWFELYHLLTGSLMDTLLRRELHSHILNVDTHYNSLSGNEKTRYLLRAENTITSIIRKYIHLRFKKGKRFLIHNCNKRYKFSN